VTDQSTGRRFRFGVSVLTPAPDRATWQDHARRYESLGFDVLVVADHLGAMFPPLVPLVSAADATDRLRVGTFVLNNDFWHPVFLARDATAADLLSDGRLELGLGAGHGETVDHNGPNYTLREAKIGFRAVQAHLPILIGGNGNRLLALAAQEADIVGLVGFTSGTGQVHSDLSHFTWAGLEERIAHVRRHAGARFAELELNVLVQRVEGGDRRSVADELAAATGRPAEVFLDSPFVMLGSAGDLVTHIERLRSVGVTYLVAFAEQGAEQLAPAIEQLSGR
jgi:alkanesulfonate monooxygenase SsuD/methylene tetrahydromethanopterin reductase-like flavin-dependent oxidoreductase (luciferase family)